MKVKYSKENKRKVDAWISDPKFQAMVEQDLGVPIKVKVRWEEGEIDFQSPTSGRTLLIKDILDAYGAQHLN